MSKNEIPNITAYLVGIIGVAWNIILGLVYLVWHTRVKIIDKAISSLKKTTDELEKKIKELGKDLQDKEETDILETNKKIDIMFSKISALSIESATVKEKVDNLIKFCDRIQQSKKGKQ
jgi:uncharacterized protein YybS (DUF2232 family)